MKEFTASTRPFALHILPAHPAKEAQAKKDGDGMITLVSCHVIQQLATIEVIEEHQVALQALGLFPPVISSLIASFADIED